MIPASIRKPRIEIPVVRRKHMEVRLHQFAAPTLETKQDRADALQSGDIGFARRQLFRDPDHRIRVFTPVHCIHPLAFGMPCAKPGGAIASGNQLELRIFEQM